MSTDPQAPQAPRSGAAAEGPIEVTPSPAGAEGRQSPGLEERLALLADFIDGARAKLQGVTDGPQLTIGNCDNAAIHLAEIRRALASPSAPQGGGESEDLKAAKVVILDLCSRLERNMDKHPFRDKGEDDRVYQNACAWLAGAAEFMKPATPSQEEGPAGVDAGLRDELEKTAAWLDAQPSAAAAEVAKRIRARLRAQAPASSPRAADLEGGRILQRDMRCPRGHSDVRYTYASDTHGTIWCEECGAKHEMAFDGEIIGNALYRAWLAAHPPEDTPIEAAGLRADFDIDYGNGEIMHLSLYDGEEYLGSVKLEEKYLRDLHRRINAPGTPIEKAAREGLQYAVYKSRELQREAEESHASKSAVLGAARVAVEARLIAEIVENAIKRLGASLSGLPQEPAACTHSEPSGLDKPFDVRHTFARDPVSTHIFSPRCELCGLTIGDIIRGTRPAQEGAAGPDYKALYHELLYQVSIKHPGESRHETALRYLRNAEKGSDSVEEGAKEPKEGGRP